MIELGPLKLTRTMYQILLGALLILLILIIVLVIKMSSGATQPGQTTTPGQITPPPASTAYSTITPTQPGDPRLVSLGQVTNQAFGTSDNNVPDSWGVQKNRIVRTSTGDLFTTYTSSGIDGNPTSDQQQAKVYDRVWHLMHKAPGSTSWQEIKNGDAGVEPINIVVTPDDTIHLFTWPQALGVAKHIYSSDLGKSFQEEVLPGHWYGTTSASDDPENREQGYSGSGVNALGDIVFFQTGSDKPGMFNWDYYSHSTHKWMFHRTALDYRYTYAFVFPGYHNDLTITAVRDARREELGYAKSSEFDYVFDALRYFYIGDINNPDATFGYVQVVQPTAPHTTQAADADVVLMEDTYMDTQGRVHILYNFLYDQPNAQTIHHVIFENGKLVKNVKQTIDFAPKTRIFQDKEGHFYLISMSSDPGTTLNIYQGTASDTDGTQLMAPVQLDISQYPGCGDYDFCHSPTLTLPRNGNALADYVDGTYGNFNKEIYFRISLRNNAGASTFVPGPAPALALASALNQMLIVDQRKNIAWLLSWL